MCFSALLLSLLFQAVRLYVPTSYFKATAVPVAPLPFLPQRSERRLLFLLCADVFQEKEDKAVLQAEVQSLRQNNQRLQEESQSTVARLIKVTELLCNVNKPC